MALDWNDLKVFLALERGGSARTAALQLGTSHSTVLRRLQSLEDGLGAKLFDRTPDGLILTGPGARLMVKAQQIEAEIVEVERDVRGADIRLQGLIRLTVPPPVAKYLLLPHLARFRQHYPEIDLEVAATYGYSDLGRRDADIAIRFSETPDDHLVGRQLPTFRDAVFASQAYVEVNFRTADNSSAVWIGWPEAARFAARISRTPFAFYPVGWRLPGLELQAEAARQGHGIALLPCIMGDRDPLLVRVPGTGTYETLPAWLLTHPDLRRMERVRVFARFLAKAIGDESGFLDGSRAGPTES
jgi:DNA-binding transcriptional LysR family regulator